MVRSIVAALLFVAGSAVAAEAQRLPTTVRPDHYDLAFDVDLASARFTGDETIRVTLSEPQQRIVLHAVDMEFDRVEIAGGGAPQPARATFYKTTETVALTVPRAVPAGPAEIRIKYRAALNKSLRGFYLSTANGRRYAVTQFESTDARRAFPSFDEPAFKATYSIALTIDAADTAISNGRLLSDTPVSGGGRHTLVFDTTPRMSSYLVAMAVGDFTCLADEADGTPLRICATPGKEALRGVAMNAAKEILPYLNRYYPVRYPFGKLDIVAVPDFAAGAMENTGAIFYREVDLLADPATASVSNVKRIWSVLAHEMAHQWFGNLVTMQWWNDLWLNEGFATWMETRPLAALKPEWHIEVDEVAATQMAMNMDGLASTHAIRAPVETPDEIESAFDAITYEKSAAVLRMIEGWVGEDAFRAGVGAYLTQHSYGNATAEDFWTAMARASGKPVDSVLATFVDRPGVPLVSAEGDCSSAAGQVTLTQSRFFLQPPASTSTLRSVWHLPLCARSSDDRAHCEVLTTPSGTMICPAGGQPLFLNAGAEGYYRTAYSRGNLRALSRDVNVLTAPERLALLGDEWALVRAGVHTAADYLTLAAGFTKETAAGVLDELAGRLGTIHDRMLTPATRPAFEGFVRSLLQPLLDQIGFDATPGSDSETLARRGTLIRALGRFGGDTAVASRARSALEAALNGGTLDPTAADAVISVAVSSGDAALWDALAAAARSAQSPSERERYLFALTQFSDPTLIDRGLALSLTDEVRAQDTARYLGRFLRNPAATARSWAFVKRHWAELAPRLTSAGGDSTLVSGLTGFCDAQARQDVRRFFAAHRLPRAARTLEQTLETISACVRLKENGTPAVTGWLSARQ